MPRTADAICAGELPSVAVRSGVPAAQAEGRAAIGCRARRKAAVTECEAKRLQ